VSWSSRGRFIGQDLPRAARLIRRSRGEAHVTSRDARTIDWNSTRGATDVAKRLTFTSIMFKPIAKPLKAESVHHRARSLPGPTVHGLAGFGAFASGAVRTRKVEHRDGAGHLEPAYESELRSRVQGRARNGERAFVNGTSSAHRSAEEAGEGFVIMVTGCGNGDSTREDRSEGRGGLLVQPREAVEFAHDTDESYPMDPTREPFPIKRA
jgi:hypothetical protein